ncbi:MAG: ATP-dependent helicase [Nitrospirae bacterium]|nr:ATP-dependent helicase [Nitrospirota bacterium]
MKKYNLKKSYKAKYKVNYGEVLNKGQLEAVLNVEGPQLVIAGAGTGKTRTLVYRVAYLVENGVSPEAILILTFTRRVAREMMRRASSLLDDRCLRVSGGTFHSFAAQILRKFSGAVGYEDNFTIVDKIEAEDIINIIRTEMGFAQRDVRFPKKDIISNVISKSQNRGCSYNDILQEDYTRFANYEDDIRYIANKYVEYKRARMIMDYDDLLSSMHMLLESHDETRKKLSFAYRYIMIDEFQDTNMIQAKIAYLLASEHKNIMVVGDDAQSIYSFRGANFRNIMDFPEVYPQCKVTALEQNYRSVQPILYLTNKIIENARERYSKTLFSEIKAEQKPVYIQAKNEYEQAAFVCQRVLELREEGVDLSDMAVLFRSAFNSHDLEVELSKANIPYVKYGGLKFGEAAHIKDIVSLLRIIYNPFDAVGWHRFLLLHEGIGPKAASEVITEIVDKKAGHSGLLSERFSMAKFKDELVNLHNVIEQIVSRQLKPVEAVELAEHYYVPLMQRSYDDINRRLEDLTSLANIAVEYDGIDRFLSDIALDPPETVEVMPLEREQEKLILSTIHSAKGLEWHTVFIIHLTEGYLPTMYSFSRQEDLEEERRLLYVACTRAKSNLYLVSPQIEYKGHSYYTFSGPSRFLNEVGDFEDLTEQWQL